LIQEIRAGGEKCAFWEVVEYSAKCIVSLPTEQLEADFADRKYGSVCSNISGIIAHLYYPLWQIVVVKKILPHGTAFHARANSLPQRHYCQKGHL